MSEYRYTLTRDLGALGGLLDERMCWVMLNPSTADDTVDDPTIRRVKSFTARSGYRHLTVINLYALRATKPGALLDHPYPAGLDNYWTVDDTIADDRTTLVVFAWGAWLDANRHRMLSPTRPAVESICRHADRRPVCLGFTASGAPRHPLLVKADTPFVPYNKVWL